MADKLEIGSTFEYKFLSGVDAPPGTFEGYGAVFNNIDQGGDRILPGAFLQTLATAKATGRMPKMLLNHGGFLSAPGDLVPIGKWEAMSEDSHGLQVKGRLFNLDLPEGKKIHTAMQEGELDGLSIGYTKPKFTRGTRAGEPDRTISSLTLKEVSVVTWAMNDLARTTMVKSIMSIDELRDLEAFLRERRNMSRADAAKAVSGFKEWLQRDAGEPNDALRDEAAAAELVAALKRAAETLSLPTR